jgi:S1-C subfamily serine protease
MTSISGRIATLLRLIAGLTAMAPAMGQITPLPLGRPTEGTVDINLNADSASFVTYSFAVADDVVALRIELEATADLDLYLDTEYIDDYQDVLASSAGYSGAERLQLDFTADPSLLSDRYFLDVTYGRSDLPLTARGEVIRSVPFTVKVTPYSLRVDRELLPDSVIVDGIDPNDGGPYRSYVIDVPDGSQQLRVDLVSDATDLDLRIRYAEPMRSLREADSLAVSWAGSETILINNGARGVPAGRYYIDVFDQAWLDWPAEFRLVASFDAAPPTGLIDLPELPRGAGLDGAARSTVEILHDDGGGSGVLLTDSGYILTNYHVVESLIEAGPNADKPLIGLTVSPTEGSKVRLLGSIVAHEKALDMAMLRVESDLYGNALPAGYRFPALARGDPGALQLGDPLFVLGYPDAGSLGTRVSITVTRGIVSGFERRGDELLIKSDADIASGNSGGPVINERFEVIGIATETISEEFGNSQIGYIWPLWLVPAQWWELAGIEGLATTN